MPLAASLTILVIKTFDNSLVFAVQKLHGDLENNGNFKGQGDIAM